MEIPQLDTSRLLLRPLVREDAVQIQQVFPRWELVRYLTHLVPWPYPEDGAQQFVCGSALPDMQKGVAWHWSIRPRTQPEKLIGLISLRLGEEDNRGFWLIPEWQGQGLMSEACQRVTDFWFRDLQQTCLRVPKAADNLASRRISESSGMRLVWSGRKAYVAGEMDAEIWEINREEWFRRHGE
ncbi:MULTISPECIES: GNAT family N-acetyltransferase [unclassified Pantoea]|uniref:GNAT family N-acetyltransferase n=1 Tax=unclassified Pantoea TaxID=2630326 RepID=UPI001FA99B76|nr:GNAT family N-acetyltransferase [Pantoea sp. MQR6]